MELTYRQADLQNTRDRHIILSLLNDFPIESSSGKPLPEKVQETLVDNLERHPTTIIYLAEHEKLPIGIAVCFMGFSTFANKPLLNLHDFYIKNAFQGMGFGKAFLQRVEQEAKARGCCKIMLEVYANNERAKTRYKKQVYSGADKTLRKK